MKPSKQAISGLPESREELLYAMQLLALNAALEAARGTPADAPLARSAMSVAGLAQEVMAPLLMHGASE